MDCISALKTRRSVRAYPGEPVPGEVLADLIDCGRLAASAVNVQPWEFVVVTTSSTLRAIAAVTDFGKFIEQAAACIVVLCRDTTKPYAETLRRMVGAPEGFRLISLLAIGHPAEKPEKEKRTLSEVLHWEKF